MSKRLPELIEPLRLAENRRLLQGRLGLATLKRIAHSLAEDSLSKPEETEVSVDLQFGIDDAGQANIRGWIEAELQLICQRCMQTMTYPVKSRVSLAIVQSDAQAEQLPGHYEPLLLPDEEDDQKLVSLSALVEDELILALPVIAMHKVEDCPAGDQFQPQTTSAKQDENDKAAQQAVTQKPNPFAVLEQLKEGQTKTRK